MDIPFVFNIYKHQLNIHLIFESLAFFIGFQYYRYLKKVVIDPVSKLNRLYVILGSIIGALLGSRLLGALEDPQILLSGDWLAIYKSKTIIGGLFGGLLGVELIKKLIGEKQSTGDLFVLPLILGIAIGRIGCFLTGILEPTYGIETSFFMGMDLGDGLKRHPLALYEILFLLLLFLILFAVLKSQKLKNGSLFKLFMISYFMFRFTIEFLKPTIFFFIGLNSIQWCCLFCFIYYYNCFIHPKKLFKNA
jgi:prolipoprotein diacylglyceryltransferase